MDYGLTKDEELSLVALMLLECGINVQNEDGSFKTMKAVIKEIDEQIEQKFIEYQASKIQ